MNSISYNYSLEFKNYLKNKIFSLIDHISDEFIYCLFSNDKCKYVGLYNVLDTGVRDLIISFIQEAVSFFDQKFKDSNERKNSFHINVQNDTRTITSCIGTFTISRTYYETKDRQDHFYFIDCLLGLEQYARYDSIFKAKTIDIAISTNQNIAATLIGQITSPLESQLNNIPTAIPRQTIFNWINSWNCPIIEYPPIDIDGEDLYIMGDEKWIHEQIYKKLQNK